MKNLFLSLIIVLLASCSSFSSYERAQHIVSGNKKTEYSFIDTTGTYVLTKKRGYSKKNKKFFVEKKLQANDLNKKILEKSLTVSQFGMLRSKYQTIPILRPEMSLYHVWFDGKKHTSQMKLNTEKRSLDILAKPSDWKGIKSFKFPDSKQLYCFYSQLIECLKSVNFFKDSLKNQRGSLDFMLIWDGFPYFQEIYSNIGDGPFSKSTITFDGENKLDEYRFTLKVSNQRLQYHLKKDGSLSRFFWVGQGIKQEYLR